MENKTISFRYLVERKYIKQSKRIKKELVIDPLAMHNDVNIKSDLIKAKMKWFWLLLSFLPPDNSDPT
jgi:hypothetical protein